MIPKVLLVRITSELPRYYEYYDSIDQLIKPPNTELLPVHSSSPAKNRNIAIKHALSTDKYTHIFFTDDDHVYPSDSLMRLLARNVDIVSGLYCMKTAPFPMIILDNKEGRNMAQSRDMSLVQKVSLLKCDRVPAGCLLVTTKALIDIGKYLATVGKQQDYSEKWFTLGHLIPDEWADDLWFCDRAQDAGFSIYVDTAVCIGHITKCILTPECIDGQWRINYGINNDMSLEHGN